MNESIRTYTRRHREGLLSAVSGGFFLILIGMIFVITPNLFDNTLTFFSNFNLTSPVPNTEIQLPAPSTSSAVAEANQAVYSAVALFSIVWGAFLIALIVVRFIYGSPIRKKADNLSDIIFWFGAFYVVQLFLVNQSQWFVFWSAMIMLGGISLIIRATFLAVVRR